ncbi:MAG: hypothetical protein CSA97_03300 [Bacteroidetes bacterium]|nr:MAG: hypothetical protein CSA97_03300 [Bacteroidota bacterium]
MGNSSRTEILERIKSYSPEKGCPRPSMEGFAAISYPDKVEQFIAISKAVLGDAVVLQPGEDINALIRSHFPDAKRIASTVEGVEGTFDPDSVESPGELNGTDLAVVPGLLGVCENGAVWVDPNMRWRALCFIAEHLVMVIPREALYNNMHEAYKAIPESNSRYRCFISGPSKTADIEQALVCGAHGPKSTLVILK